MYMYMGAGIVKERYDNALKLLDLNIDTKGLLNKPVLYIYRPKRFKVPAGLELAWKDEKGRVFKNQFLMKNIILVSIVIAFLATGQVAAQAGKAQWISAPDIQNVANTWLAYKKEVNIPAVPVRAIAKIAVDSKYWLWINGELRVFEGGLKRGPNPKDSYYDEVDISPFLKPGRNSISVLVWYFGKDGFSHKNSGKAGLLFDCKTSKFAIVSDKSWKCKLLDAFKTAAAPNPNFRLPESNILFDARAADASWLTDLNVKFSDAVELGAEGAAPWNRLQKRPIPLFKDFGLKKYSKQEILPGKTFDTLVCQLPYNAQITPYIKLDGQEGSKITICTDNYLYFNGGADYIRAEYISKKGIQEYESLGWINGHKVYYIVPKGVKVLEVKFRESGYDTEFSGSFDCNDPFYNLLWEKSRRTLYVTMRDSYMDCPDRERAQWTGDAVNESGETFYALSPSSHALSKKWLLEIVNWRRDDGVLFSPVPAGNWKKELPDQSLATVGYYGLWNYYLNTGDRQTLQACYGAAKDYLLLWKPDGKGTVDFRGGDWTWGDWGSEKDTTLIFSAFYYLSLKGMQLAAHELGRKNDAAAYAATMKVYKQSFNAQYWNGISYRSKAYKGKTDDRVQALAVVSGLADQEKYPAILSVFKQEEHASPYMEKYVMEALFMMKEGAYGLERHKKRFSRMVNYPEFSTLWEGWNFNDPVYGGGTVNHAWSGGALTILSQYLCGVAPISAGYKTFQVLPQPGGMERASATVTTVNGTISTSFAHREKSFVLTVNVPKGTSAVVGIPAGYKSILLDDKLVWMNGRYAEKANAVKDNDAAFVKFKLGYGKWKLTGKPTYKK